MVQRSRQPAYFLVRPGDAEGVDRIEPGIERAGKQQRQCRPRRARIGGPRDGLPAIAEAGGRQRRIGSQQAMHACRAAAHMPHHDDGRCQPRLQDIRLHLPQRPQLQPLPDGPDQLPVRHGQAQRIEPCFRLQRFGQDFQPQPEIRDIGVGLAGLARLMQAHRGLPLPTARRDRVSACRSYRDATPFPASRSHGRHAEDRAQGCGRGGMLMS